MAPQCPNVYRSSQATMFCEEYNILRHKKTGVALLAEPGRCGGFLPSAGTPMRHREHHPAFFNKNKKIYLLIFHVVCHFELTCQLLSEQIRNHSVQLYQAKACLRWKAKCFRGWQAETALGLARRNAAISYFCSATLRMWIFRVRCTKEEQLAMKLALRARSYFVMKARRHPPRPPPAPHTPYPSPCCRRRLHVIRSHCVSVHYLLLPLSARCTLPGNTRCEYASLSTI